ncbi:uncharacterized protein LOC109814004 [Cajanus cajan]|uniref:uncharacterized protein LOC109814004 n=1 Tax=Cajanus cajan TaxID=3821 RepID=UPI00098D9405|nr:uncharacterized protein LOC109814004 [Cajanus cajan]
MRDERTLRYPNARPQILEEHRGTQTLVRVENHFPHALLNNHCAPFSGFQRAWRRVLRAPAAATTRAATSPRSNIREQDRYLPIANISRIMKKALRVMGRPRPRFLRAR